MRYSPHHDIPRRKQPFCNTAIRGGRRAGSLRLPDYHICIIVILFKPVKQGLRRAPPIMSQDLCSSLSISHFYRYDCRMAPIGLIGKSCACLFPLNHRDFGITKTPSMVAHDCLHTTLVGILDFGALPRSFGVGSEMSFL
jgi:hypothetical protein